MKSIYCTLCFCFILGIQGYAQNSHTETRSYYYEIPDGSESYTAATVTARMLDGLGFRFYWASEGLRAEDLAYKPSEDARTCGETIDHINGLVLIIKNTVFGVPNTNTQSEEFKSLSYAQKRALILQNIQQTSVYLKEHPNFSLENNPIHFKNGNQTVDIPFWNLINGPIADAIYHTGQVVVFRRNSGNPINPKLNQFTGKVQE